MRRTLQLILFLLLIYIPYSCETELDTNAPWKEITVIYGLLDQYDSIQIIKVNRAFLGEGNALLMAQTGDSGNYAVPPEVYVEDWDGGTLRRTIEFDTFSVYNQESGIFGSRREVMFRSKPFSEPVTITGLGEKIWLDDDHTYRLMVRNPVSGNEVTAQTGLVKEFSITKPSSISDSLGLDNDPEAKTTFRWTQSSTGTRYEFEFRFHFMEVLHSSPDTLHRHITLATSTQKKSSSDEMSLIYYDQTFFQSCLAGIPYTKDPGRENDVKERIAGKMEVIVASAVEEFDKYIDVNNPDPTSIVIDPPIYTNVNNGIGIFSSRMRKIKEKILRKTTLSQLIYLDNTDTTVSLKFLP
ncbi:MAG: DUF4249 family protein [Bacteroidales bacterium]|nr:DUF4249 family protein [Bacteroidales bacterium]